MKGAREHNRLVTGEVIPGADGTKGTSAARADNAFDAEILPAGETRNRPRERRKAGPLLFWSTLILAAFLVFWMSGGHRLVLEPLARSIRNAPAQALQIEEVTSRLERFEGKTHLVVDGVVRNRGATALSVPPILIAVAETDGPTMRYFLETGTMPLASGADYGFSSRLDAPAKGVASVSITFQEGSR